MNGIPDILIPLAAILTPDHLLLLVSGFLAVVLFIMVGVEIFSRGWESYEERYVQGAEKPSIPCSSPFPASISFTCPSRRSLS